MGERVTPEAISDAFAIVREAERRQAIADRGEAGHLVALTTVATDPAMKRSRKRCKRKGRPGMVRLDADSPILAQVRNLGA